MLTNSERLHNTLVGTWQDYARAFYAMPPRGSRKQNEWQSDVRNGYVFEQIMTLHPRLIDQDYGVNIMPLEKGISREHLRTIEKGVGHWLWRDNHLERQSKFVLPLQICGIGWTKTVWKWRRLPRTVRSTPEQMMQGQPAQSTIFDVVDDRPSMVVPHPFDVLWDPNATMLEEARWIIHRVFIPKSQLFARRRRVDSDGRTVGAYDNVSEVKGSGQDRDASMPNELPEHVVERRKNNVEVLEFYDMERNRVVTIANRSVVLRDIENPYPYGEHPFSAATTQTDIARLDGISEVKMLESLQTMLWLVENQRLDNTRLSMDTVLMIRDTVENFDELQIRPGAKWPVANPSGDIVPLQMPQPQLASMQDIESLRGRLQSITGMTYLTGGDPSAMGVNQNTASGIMAIQEEAKERVGLRASLVRSQAYDRHVNLSLLLAAQYLTEPFIVGGKDHVVDPIEVTWEMFQPRMWARSKTLTDTMSRSMNQQNAQMGIQSIAALMNLGIQFPDGTMPNPEPFLEMMAESMDKEVEAFKMPVPPADPNAGAPHPVQKLMESINYRDLPPVAQSQLLHQAGLDATGVAPTPEQQLAQVPDAGPNAPQPQH